MPSHTPVKSSVLFRIIRAIRLLSVLSVLSVIQKHGWHDKGFDYTVEAHAIGCYTRQDAGRWLAARGFRLHHVTDTGYA